MAHGGLVEPLLSPECANFIPASYFGLNDIPKGFRSPTVLQYIKNVSARTVKVIRTCDPGLSTRSLKDGKRYGSGLVIKVEHLKWTCECLECKNSLNPESHCWVVFVQTTNQLVANAQEAKETLVELFYDREEGSVITLQGADVEDNSYPHVSLLVCFTHDADLARLLENYRKESMDLKSAILKEVGDDADVTQYVIVCHPVGQPKSIWVGSRLDRVGRCGDFNTALRVYGASMCPGVQGAPVIVLHKKDCPDGVWMLIVDNSFQPFNMASNHSTTSFYC